VAWQLQREGYDVEVGQVQDKAQTVSPIESPDEDDTDKERRLSLYDGMLKKRPAEEMIRRLESVKDPENVFVFSDLNHLYRYSEQLEGMNFKGNFPTEEDYNLEIDREAAKDFVATHYPQMRVGAKKRFKKASEAREFLEQSEDLWVLKGLEEDARTVVPDVDDLELARGQIMDALGQNPGEYESAGFILELLIPSALELTPQKIYLDGHPVATCMCIENKPMGAGNIGPMTDCAQDLVFSTELDDKINAIAFPPIVDEIASRRRGIFYWDASILVEPKTGRLYFGEFCSNRAGYNCLYTEMALAGGAGKYFDALARGKSPYPAHSVAASVRIFNFHKEGGAALSGATIDFKDRAAPNLWLKDAKMRRRRTVSAGYKEDLGVVTGAGRSVSEAATRAYRAVDEFSFEGAYQRPEFDFCSREYGTSILRRLDYGLQRGLYKVGFGLL